MIENLDAKFQAAVVGYWNTRSAQQIRQIESGSVNTGTRGAVTGGLHMSPLEQLLTEILVSAGISSSSIRTRSALELPGYYRPEKRWDLLVIEDGQLVMALEMKSQVGSFGNNFNNRVEEAIGNAEDIWTAYREGRFGGGPAPFLGYFFLLEDTARIHSPVRASAPHFPVDPIFVDASYAKRYEIFCKRLVLERKYTAACLTLATNVVPAVITFPATELTFAQFAISVEAHALEFLERQKL